MLHEYQYFGILLINWLSNKKMGKSKLNVMIDEWNDGWMID